MRIIIVCLFLVIGSAAIACESDNVQRRPFPCPSNGSFVVEDCK